ncbi:helix-turn-helix domain-containing protein [Terrisporobacter othiniensis]|uniref:helix-turn-helix domain-containing protein n=1 Tax=Terrisporobacter othiniensis TaxID=1577792 RepID=UPI00068DED2A|nr:helix-turn-helix transcriptional regulator [Terrisporobacter othiniensis]
MRKNRGFTKEELAQVLYVSRTAISKWESGRGYLSIDSLKEISNYFGVTIDDLLFGMVDLFSFILIVLSLYPKPINGYIFSVNLFSHTETTWLNRWIYWIMFIILIMVGIVKIVLTQFKIEKGYKNIYI